MKKEELKFYYFQSQGKGGQRKNKKLIAVKVVHIPTGLWAVATETRSQYQNKQLALKRLEEKLNKLNEKKKERIPTTKPDWAKEKQIREKKHKSEIKKLRRRVDESYC